MELKVSIFLQGIENPLPGEVESINSAQGLMSSRVKFPGLYRQFEAPFKIPGDGEGAQHSFSALLLKPLSPSFKILPLCIP